MKCTSYLLLPLLSLIVFSCGKDDQPKQPTKTEIIAQATWKYDNGGIDNDKNGTVDIPATGALLLACQADNTLLLNTNGTGVIDEGTTKCNTTDPQSMPITWNFTNNETALRLSGGSVLGIGGEFKVLELSTTKLSLSKDTTIAFLGPVALVLNLKH
jgi:hypothetical protein